MKKRCNWAKSDILIKYHDNRWGVPIYDDLKLFNLLCLESFQAGLSWEIILNKEVALNDAFDNFNPDIVSKYNDNKITELMNNPLIIRNKLKIKSMINNSKMFLKHFNSNNTFNDFIWRHSNYQVIDNHYNEKDLLPVTLEIGNTISKKLKELGFKFVGEKIVYSFLEAMGLYNNHIKECFKYEEIKRIKR
ncbi:MAG: DNA-3-methyladenine glycosylase I [Acholeplasmataceae bacterium]